MISPRAVIAVAVVSVILVSGGSPLGAADWPLRIVTVARTAEVRARSGPEWKAASLGAEVGPGDAVRTLIPGRLTLVSPSGQSLRLAPLSRLQLAGDSAGAPIRAKLDSGWLWVAVLPGTPSRESFEVEAGPVTVTVREGGVGVMHNPDGSVTVRAYHGGAECVGTAAPVRWARPLAEGEELLVSAAGTADKVQPITRGKPEADWVKVNEAQDLAGGYGAPAPRK